MKLWFRAAIVCAVAPMITGVGIFLTWLATRADWLEAAGLITLGVGPFVVLVGLICLIIYIVLSRRPAGQGGGRAGWLRPIMVGGLLLANFPVGLTAFNVAWYIETRYIVEIRNAAPIEARSVTLTGGGMGISFGDIPPGGRAKRDDHVRTDGTLILTATLGNRAIEAEVDGYITNSVGGHKIITIGPNGEVNVVDVIHR